MDDFLEMERLACLSTDSNGAISISDSLINKRTEVAEGGDLQSKQQPSANQVSSNAELSAVDLESDTYQMPLSKLQSRISMIFDSQADTDIEKILEDIKCIVKDILDTLPQHFVSYIFEEFHSIDATCNRQACPQDIRETTEGPISLIQDSKPGTDTEHVTDQELLAAISQIHDFVLSLGNEAMTAQETSPDGHWLSQKIEELSASVNKVLYSKMSLADFVLDLSHILAKASELNINVLGYKGKEGETSSSDCVEKVTLLENKVDYPSRHIFPRCCGHISHSTSNPEVPREGNLSPGFELKTISCKCSSEELEQLKSEKDSMTMDLARCIENLQNAKSQLQDTEQLLAELKSQLASSQKSNSLAETQLKCMAESYKSLEMRAHKLETEVNLMRAKTETLDTELHEEKRCHQDALARCKDLHEQMQRNERCLMCSLSSVADVDIKTKQVGV
ncbi:hypothetical protein HHK36_026070 [Tetracentron sinense]|uniref:Uncharacterized protein n=1 Tax=Tetracentron sinense TaxID=13715 RepID=A0A834YJX9_TETSI|nr:hypothetical protein HHK36_026070 [Tetracentron sinense]